MEECPRLFDSHRHGRENSEEKEQIFYNGSNSKQFVAEESPMLFS